ncbi:MAG: glycosyltransferase, partial [bacterium]|nr:glycosyltransferase [bacterium]
MKDPMISIIIPVRNAERTLEKTFEYLFGVDYPRDRMEIVIADGGSTAKTVEIIKNWQKKYTFIKLVDVPNFPSPGYARNKALAVVQGEYLFF